VARRLRIGATHAEAAQSTLNHLALALHELNERAHYATYCRGPRLVVQSELWAKGERKVLTSCEKQVQFLEPECFNCGNFYDLRTINRARAARRHFGRNPSAGPAYFTRYSGEN
jgi:hypothetical protein